MKILFGWRLIALILVLPMFGCATNGVADYRSSGINEKVVLEPKASNGFKGVLVEMPPAPAGALESRAMEICNSLGGVKNTPTYSHTVPLGWKLYNYQCNGYKLATSSPSSPAQPVQQPVQQATSPNIEIERLRTEAEEAKRKQAEVEEQLRLAQQPTKPNKPTVSSGAERRVALVIGNATYKFNPLKNPVNDSTDMARSLRSVGFDVIEANNTTLSQMREATRKFADKLGSSDVGLVYFSGHGIEVKGRNYLIPVNADIKREYEVVDQAFDASQFLEMMDNIRGPNNKRVNILIIDACRNNELQRSWRSTNNGLARMDAPGGTFISFATAPGKVAADGEGRNSPYTKHLLQALKQPNVLIEQVFKVVRRNVMDETKGEQIPWENSSLVGDFYFTVKR